MMETCECLTCSHCVYIHEYEEHFCTEKQTPVRDAWREGELCDFYDRYTEDN